MPLSPDKTLLREPGLRAFAPRRDMTHRQSANPADAVAD